MTPAEALEVAAQAWCDPETSSIPMDGRLAEAFARRLLLVATSGPALVPALMDVAREIERARLKHPKPYGSSHEGWAILREEVDELWDEVKCRTDERSYAKMRMEAVQIAAVAIRFVEEVCDARVPSGKAPSAQPPARP